MEAAAGAAETLYQSAARYLAFFLQDVASRLRAEMDVLFWKSGIAFNQ